MGKNKNLPVLTKWEDREKSILDDTPAVIKIERDPKAIKWDLWDELRTFNSKGKNAVQKHDKIISDRAKKHNLDPDIVRAVMYAENARGHYVVMNDLMDKARLSKSILPMNIQNDRWSKLIDKEPDDLYDVENNIETSAVLLKRIANRLEKPTPENIGTLWNSSAQDKTSVFGEYIRMLYDEKPWAKME